MYGWYFLEKTLEFIVEKRWEWLVLAIFYWSDFYLMKRISISIIIRILWKNLWRRDEFYYFFEDFLNEVFKFSKDSHLGHVLVYVRAKPQNPSKLFPSLGTTISCTKTGLAFWFSTRLSPKTKENTFVRLTIALEKRRPNASWRSKVGLLKNKCMNWTNKK